MGDEHHIYAAEGLEGVVDHGCHARRVGQVRDGGGDGGRRGLARDGGEFVGIAAHEVESGSTRGVSGDDCPCDGRGGPKDEHMGARSAHRPDHDSATSGPAAGPT